jgi:hypothetical protein
VFPRDTQIPVAAIARYWAHTRGHDATKTMSDLHILEAANVLRLDGDTVGFHDLQHDYLLLHAPSLALLHAELLNAYRAALPAGRDRWWRLPSNEPYLWDHLVTHLRGAGGRAILASTVTNPAYLAHRIASGGAHAAETDLNRAAEAIPDDAGIQWWQPWLARHANLLTATYQDDAHPRDVSALAPTFLAWLTAEQKRPQLVDPAELSLLLPTPYLSIRWGLTPPPETLVRVLTGHTRKVNALAWAPDGTRLASAGNDGQVRIWNPDTGTHKTLTGHTDWVNALAWSPDGTHLASAGNDRLVRIWNPNTGTHTTLTRHPSWVNALAWAPDGTQLASASADSQVRIWNP